MSITMNDKELEQLKAHVTELAKGLKSWKPWSVPNYSEFLALYALTQGDSIKRNGTWDDLPVQNGEVARTALFGSGAQLGGLIPAVHIGGIGGFSTYKDMREILDRLGIVATAVDPHQHHFHVYLKPPAPLAITANLMASQADVGAAGDEIGAQQQAAQSLLDYAQALITGEELMITMEVPYVPPQEAPIVLVQAADTSSQPDYQLNACREVPTAGGAITAMNMVDPAVSLVGAVLTREHRQLSSWEEGSALERSVKLTLLQGVAHGQLIPHSPNGRVFYEYRSEPGYLGNDQAIFMAEFEGKRYRIVVKIIVSEGIDDYNPQCPPPPGKLIKITQPSSGFNGYDLNSVSVSFADLEGSAVGQTVGANITLDTTAAGHGWFIDTTPADSSEYLPTSNPNEWVAKEGTDAYGKMDLLSVLLHEYGHILGLDHGTDSHSLMSPELKPGVRHTVSTAEMAAIADRLGIGLPSDPSTPFNPLPWSTSLLFGFTRRREATGNGIVLPPLPDSDPNATSVTPTPIYSMSVNYQEALHTGLYNGDFSLFDPASVTYGWNTHGNVSLTNGIAEIAEDARAMSGLTQTFIKPEGITGLRFTLLGADFGTDGTAPPDAFEMALLDAETGQSVLGAAGLSNTDALLNNRGQTTDMQCVCERLLKAQSDNIDQLPRLIDASEHVWIPHRPHHHQINRTPERFRQRVIELEILRQRRIITVRCEFDKEVCITALRIEVITPSRRSEYLQAANAITPAQLDDLVFMHCDQGMHGSTPLRG